MGADHRGVGLKDALKAALVEQGHQVDDLGTHSTDSVDYPDIAGDVARAVAQGRNQCGILVCGTGIGMSISANKVHGVRAAVVSETTSARLARQHNNANVVCVGAEIVGVGLAREIVETFLATQFEGGRHQRRVDKIQALDDRAAAVKAGERK